MKVALICDVLGDPNNGTSIAAYNLINYLKNKGHEVHVICSDEDKEGLENYHIMPKRDFWIFNGYIAKNGVSLSRPNAALMEEVIKKVDVVHTLVPFVLSKVAVRLARKYNIPVTSSCHMQAENFTSHFFVDNIPFINNLLYRYLYHKVYKYATCIHYPSQFICDYLNRRGFDRLRPYVITNGVNKGIYPKEASKPEAYQDKIIILYTARYVKEKRQDILIRAIKYSKYRDRIKVIFAGKGPKLEHLKKLTKKLKVDDNIEFNFYTREQMNDLINYADLYVHPSDIEIEAIAANEAISCGLVPIISNSNRSAATMFALSDLNLFKHGKPRDLAKKIDFWIESPRLKSKIKELYLESRNPLSVNEAMEQMELMLYEAISLYYKETPFNEKNRRKDSRVH